jgi:hypothetical protein
MWSRRHVIVGALSALFTAMCERASAAWGIFQVSGSSALPAGVTLQVIDGGSNYFSAHSFTYAANSASNGYPLGWDDPNFFATGIYLHPVDGTQTGPGGISDSATLNDLGINSIWAQTSNTSYALLRAATPPISLICKGDERTAQAVANPGGIGSETVGFLTTDEPTTIADAIDSFASGAAYGYDAGHGGTGTPNSDMDQRFIWTNFTIIQQAFNNVGGTGPMTAVLSRAVATPSGTGIWATRSIDIYGMDAYWELLGRLSGGAVGGLSNGSGGAGNIMVITNSRTPPAYGIGIKIRASFSTGTPTTSSDKVSNGASQSGPGTYNSNSSSAFIAPGTLINFNDGFQLQAMANVISNGNNFGGNAGVPLTRAECLNGAHYGDSIDYILPWCGSTGGISAKPQVGITPLADAKGDADYNMTPEENQWSWWSHIIHGVRGIVYFAQGTSATAPYTSFGAHGPLFNSYFQAPQTAVITAEGGNAYTTNFTGGTGGVSSTTLTVSAISNGQIRLFQQILSGALSGKKIIAQTSGLYGGAGTYTLDSAGTLANGSSIACAYSVYHSIKYTSKLTRALAPLINSSFAMGYITGVSPQGYNFRNVSQVKSGGIDCCAKYLASAYTDQESHFPAGTFTKGFYIFATTRESQFNIPGNYPVTFTINHPGATLATNLLDGSTHAISGGGFTDTFVNAWDFHVYKIT